MKLWGGRFEKETNAMVDAFNACIGFGSRLYEQDILGSIAHATMLGEENIIPPEDAKKIVEGLKGILADAREGKIQWSTEAEDIHMNVETLLIQRIGEAGKRLHTGRSRNDQCVLDTRMYARQSCVETRALLDELIETLLTICTGSPEHHHAGLYPSAKSAARHAGPLHDGLCADVPAGSEAFPVRLRRG